MCVCVCVAKLYDTVPCDRLGKWFKPHSEQAGSKAGRGRLEHILTLRLLTDTARRKRLKFYETFVDFIKAYNKVRRNVRLGVLKRLGCGTTELLAIVAMYRVTECIVGTAVVTASVGVRQGSSTFCLLFIKFVYKLWFGRVSCLVIRSGADG